MQCHRDDTRIRKFKFSEASDLVFWKDIVLEVLLVLLASIIRETQVDLIFLTLFSGRSCCSRSFW
jgi:hypothetical protein